MFCVVYGMPWVAEHGTKSSSLDRSVLPDAHWRRNKMMDRIRVRFYWPEYLQDVDLHLNTCRPCLNRGNAQRRRAPLQIYNTGFPFERLSIDILGPFNRTPRGNVY